MKIIKSMITFLLVFMFLAVSIAFVCMAVETDNIDTPSEPLSISDEPTKVPAEISASNFSSRLVPPAKNNKYYYSDSNVFYKYGYGMPNCTCYAWGRAYEILGVEPQLCSYSAYLWYDYNKDNGYYRYGQTPKLGAIACWVYSSGTAGHVAVVEKITSSTVTFSNSAYGGDEFYITTAPIDDPSNGDDTWIFQGYIYIGDYEDQSDASPQTGDVYRIISDNGVNMRSGAGTSYKIVGAISYGQDVIVTQAKVNEGYTWGFTNYNGKSGWFVTDFAQLICTKTEDDNISDDNASDDEQRLLIGDVDADGYVTIMDATRIQKVLAGYYTPSEYVLAVGDVDGDSYFTILDATRLQRILACLMI